MSRWNSPEIRAKVIIMHLHAYSRILVVIASDKGAGVSGFKSLVLGLESLKSCYIVTYMAYFALILCSLKTKYR
jgi:hypothetical protein